MANAEELMWPFLTSLMSAVSSYAKLTTRRAYFSNRCQSASARSFGLND